MGSLAARGFGAAGGGSMTAIGVGAAGGGSMTAIGVGAAGGGSMFFKINVSDRLCRSWGWINDNVFQNQC
jgi:hypothetical protein